MKARDRPRFDIDALRDLAGEKVFARGEAYHRDGQVQIIALDPARVLSQVAGTEDYRTALTGRGKAIGGECSCPAFSDWGFCKHMVATALAANAAGGDAEAEGAGTLARMRDHLRKKGIDALVDMIVGMAEHDPALFRRLDLAATAVYGDDKTLETRLRKAIDGATPTRGFVEYREAGGWAEGVASVLDAVADLVSAGRGGLALRLADRMIDRIAKAIEQVDDSDGHCGELLLRARDIHCEAARAARPDPVMLARSLFDREMSDDYGTFQDAALLYADALGDAGLAEYRRLATEAWAKLPPRTGDARGRTRGSDTSPGNHSELMRILDVFAERDGDVEARIALRAKDLSSAWNYLRLAEFCLSQGREQEALSRAEEGLWIFEDSRPDTRLVLFVVGLLGKLGRKGDAQAHLWRAFERAPDLGLYERLRKLGGKSVRDRAIAFLETRLAKGSSTTWQLPGDLLVQVLAQETMFDAAWAAVLRHGVSRSVKDALARASEATHPREAVGTYTERIDQLANSGGDRAYQEAAQLIGRMANLQSPAEQNDYVAALKERFGRRRNLMKLLS